MNNNRIDKEQIEAIARGSQEAFRRLFLDAYPKIYLFTLGFLKNKTYADDIVQTVFIKIWTKRKFLLDVNNIDSYLYTVTKNTILNHIISHRHPLTDIASVPDTLVENVSPQEALEAKDLKLFVDMIVDQMPPQRQTIYRMSREEGLKNEDIATCLGLQKKTVENHLNMALRDIRKMLKIIIFLLVGWW
ncbi:MAG: RNA polymerase sigma-70 factor [Prevotella sp.]|nr:RNA polymerase sigma-70 factor [Prevotella sp.]